MEVNRPAVVAEVRAEFERYERALVANDVAVLDELFWKSPAVVRFGATENLYGHDEIAQFRAQRSAADLARELERVEVATFGDDFAVASAEFRRTSSGVAGRQQQTWVRTAEGWRIVAAHISRLG
jgi:ketosteroid isomerase-like protein